MNIAHPMNAVGVLEISGWSVGIVATDAMLKAADVRIEQAELNDLMGVIVKIRGDTSAVQAAIDAGLAMAKQLRVTAAGVVQPAPAAGGDRVRLAAAEFNPLIEQDVVHIPTSANLPKGDRMSEQNKISAIGFIETQGFAAVIDAVDAACKAGNVEVVGREKLGGGYISVILRGDVAAVRAAVDAGRARVEQMGLGKLIATNVIPRPSPAISGLLPKG